MVPHFSPNQNQNTWLIPRGKLLRCTPITPLTFLLSLEHKSHCKSARSQRTWGPAPSDVDPTGQFLKIKQNLWHQVRHIPKWPARKIKHKEWASLITVTSSFHTGPQDSVIVSLYDYPSFGHTELTMCIGEQLTIVSEYEKSFNVWSPLMFSSRLVKWQLLILSNSDGDFVIVRSTTTGHESYIPTTYTAKVTHK